MGVVYKLKQNIIDFIVQKKKNDPAYSCRKLEAAIRQEFGISVSKSSVNEVIKEFHLSGSVGRPLVYKAPKNFFIPREKKQTLLKNVQLFLTPVEEAPLPPEPPGPALIPEGIEKAEDIEHKDAVSDLSTEAPGGVPVKVPADRSVDVPEDDRALLLRPDPIAESRSLNNTASEADQVQQEVVFAREKQAPDPRSLLWLGDAGALYGRLGVAAMWFAFKSACARSLLGETLARAMGALPEGVSAEQCEVLFFTALLGEHRQGFESNDLRTLWRLAGLEDRQGRALLERAAALDANKALLVAVRTELTIAGAAVNYFRLLTKKGARFYMDAATMALQYEFIDAGLGCSLPVFMAVERAVDRVITNVLPLIAEVSGVGLKEEVLSFIRLMEGADQEEELSAVELMGDNDTKCAEFKAISLIRRRFIFCARLSEPELARVEYVTIGNKKIFSSPVSGHSFGYFEGSLALEGLERPLRVLSVSFMADSRSQEVVLLSNILSEDTKSEDILEQFFSVKLFQFMGMHNRNSIETIDSGPQSMPLSCIFRDIDILTRKFFLTTAQNIPDLGWEGMCETLYDLPGYIKESPAGLFIRFEIPEGFAHRERLVSFLCELNSAALKAPNGQLIIFSINN